MIVVVVEGNKLLIIGVLLIDVILMVIGLNGLEDVLVLLVVLIYIFECRLIFLLLGVFINVLEVLFYFN